MLPFICTNSENWCHGTFLAELLLIFDDDNDDVVRLLQMRKQFTLILLDDWLGL